LRIFRKEIAHRGARDRLLVLGERLPGGGARQGRHGPGAYAAYSRLYPGNFGGSSGVAVDVGMAVAVGVVAGSELAVALAVAVGGGRGFRFFFTATDTDGAGTALAAGVGSGIGVGVAD